ncbi:cytochrome P450 [Novosphingobium mangrovi (ex Hu et al. 2023)]|uniref:Cytochrome P450 n=1 Tax=Novosphingobium mangrovi (ex Hu et al. 2023) TaxID=2930094 RepID=A0ABT0AGN5_9SPHN|nr:cytochrome P450 [Novosphingobium mangrovi (ex Hu et al. 2023)]MCJ1962371.1 cytochrome P450 [Novosphingobium mangrovi (ex Hu et al. 2023)]
MTIVRDAANDDTQARPGMEGEDARLVAEATLLDPVVHKQPRRFYAAMRKLDPVHYDAALDMYLVSRWEDIQTVQRDPLTFSVNKGYHTQQAKGFAEEFQQILREKGGGYFPDAIMSDPPYHTRVRKLMESAFTAHRVKDLEPRIEAVVDGLLAELADKGAMDAVTDFAQPLTIRIICEQLGLDWSIKDRIARWSTAVTAQIGRMQDREEMLGHAAQICELQQYLIAKMREREADPREDMISDIVHARDGEGEGSVLTFEEAVSLIRALLIAGNETTATALSNLVLILATEPDVAEMLRASADDDRLMNRFVEELLRIEPPVRGLSRMTTKEVELGGRVLPEGAHLLLLYASANDEPEIFPEPRRFDMERKNIMKHVSFGGGVHKCVGLALARMEIKVAARLLVRKFADVRLAIAEEDIAYLPTVATRSIESLPVTFTLRD